MGCQTPLSIFVQRMFSVKLVKMSFQETQMSRKTQKEDALFEQDLYFLQQTILATGGFRSVRSLHGCFGQISAPVRCRLGKSLQGLQQFLMSLPEYFALMESDDGEVFVTLAGTKPYAVTKGLDFLKRVISSNGGSCSLWSLHGHLRHFNASLISLLGKRPQGFKQCLMSMPEHFALRELDDGEVVVFLAGKTHGVTDSLEFINQVILSSGGSCNVRSLHGHLGHLSAAQRSRLGKTPEGLLKFLMSRPGHFTLKESDDGMLVSLSGKSDAANECIKFLSGIIHDCNGMQLDCIVQELQLAKRCIRDLVGLTKTEVLSFLQKHKMVFEVCGSIVRCRGRSSAIRDAEDAEIILVLDLIDARLRVSQNCMTIVKLYEDLKHLAPHLVPIVSAIGLTRLLLRFPEHFMVDVEGYVRNSKCLPCPEHHRGPVKRLEKRWGIIQFQQNGDIYFGSQVLVAQDLGKELQKGSFVDCLFVRMTGMHGLKHTALRVWKGVIKPCLEIRLSKPLKCPLLCGTASVQHLGKNVGFLAMVGHDRGREDREAGNYSELVIFNLQHCRVPGDFKVAANARVSFLAVRFQDCSSPYRIWDCLQMWQWRPSELPFSSHKVSATLDAVSGEGGVLLSDAFPGPKTFYWDTIMENADFSRPLQLVAKQRCLATVFTAAGKCQIIVSLRPEDSANVHRHSKQACRPFGRSRKTNGALVKPRFDSGNDSNSSSSLHDSMAACKADDMSAGKADDVSEMKGTGHILSTDVYGGLIKSDCGEVVAFNPNCFYHGDKPACISYFPVGTMVFFRAVAGETVAVASKVWVEDSEEQG